MVVRASDGRIFGFEATDGTRRWVFDRGVPLLSLRGNGTPVIGGGAVFAGYDNGKVVALGLADGKLLWEQALAQPEGRTELDRMVDVDGEIALAGTELYAASHRGQVGQLASNSGRQQWVREMSAYAGIAVAGGMVFVADVDGVVHGLDAGSGSSTWKQEGLAHRWLSSPVAIGNHVAIGDLEGYVHWLDASDGKLAARVRVGKQAIRAAPLAVGNDLYVADTEGTIAAFRVGG